MSASEALPSRRDEAWRYSDLRAALRDMQPLQRQSGGHPIARLAGHSTLAPVLAGEHRVLVLDWATDAELDARAEQVSIQPGGRLTRIVLLSGSGVCLSLFEAQVESGGAFEQFVFCEGARFARVETHVTLAGSDAMADLSGAYLVRDGYHGDLTSIIRHEAPNATTRQNIKGGVFSGGRAVFQGKIFVAPGAQGTSAEQHHDALLLEDGAEVFAKPELEIHADDVSCAHGNTAGALDEAALFYMRSRGINLAAARAILIEAFVKGAIPDWVPDGVRDTVEQRISACLGARS